MLKESESARHRGLDWLIRSRLEQCNDRAGRGQGKLGKKTSRFAGCEDQNNERSKAREDRCREAAATVEESGGEPGGSTKGHPTAAARTIIAKACSAPRGLEATVRGSNSQTSATLKAPTLELFSFTFGLGLVADFSTKREFVAVTNKGENVPRIHLSERLQGIAPPVPFISWRPWKVDTRRSRFGGRGDWFGVTAGISLVEPLDHLYLGAMFEPLPGFGFVLGYHFQTRPFLKDGYKDGDSVPGGLIATERRWDLGHDVFTAINFDASLLTRLVGTLSSQRK